MDKEKGKQKKKTKRPDERNGGQPDETAQGKGKEIRSITKMGREERQMMLAVTGPQPPLEYPMHLLALADGTCTQEYEIPEEEREAVFRKLYLFDSPPSMDDVMLDIHEDKKFKVRDFRVIREDDGNFIVSPYYPVSGGTLLDWVNCSEMKKGSNVVIVANVFRKEPRIDTNEHE